MRVAMILPSLDRSGPGIQVMNLVEALLAQQVNVEIFVIKDCSGEKLNFEGLKPQKINPFSFIKTLKKFDIVHSHGFFPDLFSSLLTIPLRKTHSVSTMHNFISEDFGNRYGGLKGKFYSHLWLAVIKLIPNIIVFTDIAKNYYVKKTSGRIIVIPSSLPVVKVVERSKNASLLPKDIYQKIINFKSQGYKVIGANSIITKVKGLDLIVQSLIYLDNSVAVFVGGGDEEKKLKDLSRKLNVYDRCLFVGFQSDPIPFLPYYDVYAVPSISESFGLSLFEAIACRVPVVCNSLPVFKELLTDDSVYFMDNTIDSFVKSVNNAFNVDNEFLQNAYDLVHNNYDSRVIADEYKKLYSEIIGNVKI